MSQQPPVPPPDDTPPEDTPPEGPPPEAAPTKRRYRGSVVAGSGVLAIIAATVLIGVTQAAGTGPVVAIFAVMLVGGIALDVVAKSTDLRSVGMGVMLGSGIGLTFTGLCVVPLTGF